jgi:hypothetical protein
MTGSKQQGCSRMCSLQPLDILDICLKPSGYNKFCEVKKGDILF